MPDMRRTFEDRCDDTYVLGLNRKDRRDRARATQKPGSPRKAAPVPPMVLAMAIRLRENDHALDDQGHVSDGTHGMVLPTGGKNGDFGRGRGMLRRLSRMGRLRGVRS